MNIFDYYFELLDKPKYMLSESETAFIEFFPLVMLGVVCVVVCVVVWVIDLLKRRKK